MTDLDKNLLWEQSGGETLLQGASLQEQLDQQNKEKVFTNKDRYVYCIDEGTPNNQHKAGICLAGSGVLLEMDQVASWLAPLNLAGIYAHQECGACAIYAQDHEIQGTPDEHGVSFAQQLSEKTGIPYAGQIPIEDMKRPSGFHDARVIYVDGTGTFQPHKSTMPNGFVISMGAFPEEATEYLLAELNVACNIALGDHGFEEKFTTETPLYVAIIGDSSRENFTTEAITEKLTPFIEGRTELQEGRIKILKATT